MFGRRLVPARRDLDVGTRPRLAELVLQGPFQRIEVEFADELAVAVDQEGGGPGIDLVTLGCPARALRTGPVVGRGPIQQDRERQVLVPQTLSGISDGLAIFPERGKGGVVQRRITSG